MGRRAVDETGKIYGRLKVLRRHGANDTGATFLCRCECGNDTVVPGTFLRRGAVKSCGCLRLEVSKESMTAVSRRLGGRQNLKHGEARSGRETPEWKIWHGMRYRCINAKNAQYSDYGGRGIKVCDRWMESYESFLEDVGRRPSPMHSIDRIDVDGDYEPSNVRWATPQEQARNRRNSVYVSAFGETRTLSEWATITGIKDFTIRNRLARGWGAEKSVSTPVQRKTMKVEAAE